MAGNWKMYKTVSEGLALVEGLKANLADVKDKEIVVCPPFTALYAVGQAIKGSGIALGAQDLFWKAEGAFTGEVSPVMLVDLGVKYVIIGHSERREYFGETDETVNNKVKAALANGLLPIVCVGESLAQRDAGITNELVSNQIKAGLAGLNQVDAAKIVIAYEPIWAIGTGRSSNGPDANQVSSVIRAAIADMYGKDTADKVRIQYGGSVKPGNIAEFMAESEIDGALVGGASLEIESFTKIVKY
jgi:triosephosphate isomerase